MAVANWSSRFETGIGIIDSQHQSLFEALNKLADSFKDGTSRPQADDSLKFLLKYAQEHFTTEERFMREAGFPGLVPHMALHAELMDKANELQARLAAGQANTLDVTIFMADWLTHHISDVDMEYVRFVRNQERN